MSTTSERRVVGVLTFGVLFAVLACGIALTRVDTARAAPALEVIDEIDKSIAEIEVAKEEHPTAVSADTIKERKEAEQKVKKALKSAEAAKRAAVIAAFEGEVLLGCGFLTKIGEGVYRGAPGILFELEDIDLQMGSAIDGKPRRQGSPIVRAAAMARKLQRLLQSPVDCPNSTQQQIDAMKAIADKLGHLYDKNEKAEENGGKLSKGLLRAKAEEVAALKREALFGEFLTGCTATDFFTPLEQADLAIQRARTLGLRERGSHIKDAGPELAKLKAQLLRIPCDDPSSPTPEPEPTPQPTGCGTATAVIFAGNERQFNIGNCGYGRRQTFEITSLSLIVPSNTITNELPPAGGNCQASGSGGSASYTCTGSMGQNVSLNLDFLNSPAGQTASYSVNGGQYSGSIAIP